MDKELFELCKEVELDTDWDDETIEYYLRLHKPLNEVFKMNRFEYDRDTEYYHGNSEFKRFDEENKVVPLYTSDYLLDKLKSGAGVIKDSNGYTARRPHSLGAPENKDPLNGRVGWHSDTAVKALLTMIIDLDKAGIL